MSNRTHALQIDFLAILPRISLHAQISFRHLKSADAKDEANAEMIALAWKWFVRLVPTGKHPEEFVSAIATYAARAVKSGRRLCGQEKAKDVLSSRAQGRRGFTVSPIPDGSSMAGNIFDEALHDNTATPIPDQVCFRIDFPAWLTTRKKRDRKLIKKLMLGEGTGETARRFGLCPSRISQLRQEFLNDWRKFCGEPTV